MKIELGKSYYWNFRTAVNVRLKAVKASEHRPAVWHCDNMETGAETFVHEDNLSEEPK